ncbi:MAG: 50S ribosomal protein L21 [Negativicutes bacterium]
MYAVIATGGKQYRVSEGDVIFVEKLSGEVDDALVFTDVLTVVQDGDVKIGAPFIEGAKVTGKVLKQDKNKKIIIYKYKSKANYRRKTGHRQPYTKVSIEKIEA